MGDQGFIYILINPSMEGLVKVGKTTKDPKERASELSGSTGVPTPFIVAYQLAVQDCTIAENFIHAYLETKGFRLNNNREFFNAPLNIAIDAMLQYKNIANTSSVQTEDTTFDSDSFLDSLSIHSKAPCQEIFELANAYHYGHDDVIEDYAEAMKLYKQAAKLGSTEAYIELSRMYLNGDGCQQDKEKALECLKEGARLGDIDCYAEMENFFLIYSPHMDNANKCWDKYINTVSLSDDNAGKHCFNYINLRLNCDVEIKNTQRISLFKDKAMEWAIGMIEYVENSGSNSSNLQRYKNTLAYINNVL